jgi:1L-myo-inositol 1-phosphate cytidylyltransferase
MCDHLVDPDIIRDLLAEEHPPDTVTLCVDFNIDNPLNDPIDVTRVRCRAGSIETVGKVIKDYDAIDTGIFLCHPVMFEALEESFRGGDESISGAMNVLASWGKARTFDIKGRLWVDVDDPTAFTHAERLIEAGRL